MKRAVTILLIPIFIFSIIGWQWMFVMLLSSHQAEEWSATVVNEKLEVFTLNADGTHDGETFLVNDHELFHRGEYFDVKYKERKGDEIVYYCHHDGEEGGLFKSFDNKIKDATDMNASKDKVQKVVKLSVFENHSSDIFFHQDESNEINFLCKIPVITLCFGNAVFVPPDVDVQVS